MSRLRVPCRPHRKAPSGEWLRSGPPKAQPARKRSGKRTAAPDGLWRAAPQGAHRRGAAPASRHPISQVTGQRGGRSSRDLPPFFWFLPEVRIPMGQRTPLYRHARRRRRAHGRFRRLGHAGQLRLADRGAPRGAPRRRHVRRLAHVRRRPARRRVRDFLRRLLANDVAKLDAAGQGALLVHAARERRRHRRPDRLLHARRVVPHGRQRRHARQGSRLAARAGGAVRRRRRAAHRSRDDRGAGPERAREGRAACSTDSVAHAALALQPFFGVEAGAVVRRAHRLHRRGRLGDHAAGRAGAALWDACAAPASRPAASARATRCASRPA